MKPSDRILLALDVDTEDKALEIVRELAGEVGGFKIGKELFTSTGPSVVRSVSREGGNVFLDLKYHDIPNTVKGACRAAAGLGVFMLNVHAAGGSAMMQAAVEGSREGAEKGGGERPLVIAVTVLTSIDEPVLRNELRIPFAPLDQVVHFAVLAQENGADGVVCSPREIEAVRSACGNDFVIVTPGIRPAWASTDDQKRIMTPSEAVSKGADYIVIGRPIRAAENRREAVRKVAEELEHC